MDSAVHRHLLRHGSSTVSPLNGIERWSAAREPVDPGMARTVPGSVDEEFRKKESDDQHSPKHWPENLHQPAGEKVRNRDHRTIRQVGRGRERGPNSQSIVGYGMAVRLFAVTLTIHT